MRSKRIALFLALLLLVGSQAACPKENDLDVAAKASNELAHDVVTAERIIAELYKAKKVSLEQKDKWAAQLKLIAVKGQSLNSALIALDKKYPQGTAPPEDIKFVKDNFAELRDLFQVLFGDLNLLGLTRAVKDLREDISTIEGAIK